MAHKIVDAEGTSPSPVVYKTPSAEYLKKDMPLSYLKYQKGKEVIASAGSTEVMVLHCASISKVQGKKAKARISFKTHVMTLDYSGSSYSSETTTELCEFSRYLTPRILPPSYPISTRSCSSKHQTPREYLDNKIGQPPAPWARDDATIK